MVAPHSFRLSDLPLPVFGPAAALVFWSSTAQASLTPSEVEQVRHDVSRAQNIEHVRALVARPDLSNGEAGATMTTAMSGTPVDPAHAAYLRELVFGSASAARPMLAVAVVRGLLARGDALMAQHPSDLDRSGAPLSEIAQAYALVEEVVGADPQAGVTDSARAECAQALAEHVARHPNVLRADAAVAPAVATVRAQAAIALFDSMPDTPARRVDAANDLGLSGPRRAALIELGILLLDLGGSDARATTLRALLERLPGARDGAEAIVVVDEHALRLHARGGEVVAIKAAPEALLTELDSPWGNEAAPPPIDAATMAAAHGIAAAAVRRALERRPQLRSAVERDGGEAGVVTMAAMLAIDAQRTVEVAAGRLLEGKRESVAWLADAIGALAVFAARPAKGDEGLAVLVGRADGARVGTARATRVSLDPTGAGSTLRLDAHTWRIVRDDRGMVVRFSRDTAPVSAKVLAETRPEALGGSSWNGGGLVFARLAGAPRVAVAAGPRVWVFGSSVFDAIAAPSPGDDVVVEADLRVEGGPAGIVVRAVPGPSRAFKGLSLVVLPGATPRAALLIGNGAGVETAASPVVDVASGQSQHVRVKVKGQKVEAKVGTTTLETILPEGFEHGDVALRAYPGASVEVAGWKVKKP
jgi:hypothetical protein